MPITGVLFDLDGTLTRPVLDFDAIRREMGIAPGTGVWEGMQAMIADDPRSREHLEGILFRHERRAAEQAVENPGAREVVSSLRKHQLHIGVVTRNARSHAAIALAQLGLQIGCLIARDDAPPKPNPAPVRLACERLGLAPADTWFIGDYVHDTAAGAAAGCAATVLITNGNTPKFAYDSTHTIDALPELLELLALG